MAILGWLGCGVCSGWGRRGRGTKLRGREVSVSTRKHATHGRSGTGKAYLGGWEIDRRKGGAKMSKSQRGGGEKTPKSAPRR